MDHHAITQDSFEALLGWLGPTRDEGARKYETVRRKLTHIFMKKGCADPEDLADTTINRVIVKLPSIQAGYVGDPTNYFCGVARIVYLESLRRREILTDYFPPVPTPDPVLAMARVCLRTCLSQIPADQRDLVLDYYVDQNQIKTHSRRELATELGISVNALRLRTFRIRMVLEKCVMDCIGEK